MEEGQDKPARRLQLSRETLRDLEPTATRAASVKGGMAQTSICGGPPPCQFEILEEITRVLPSTHHSWGCVGSIRINHGENETTVEYDLHPSDEVQEFAREMLRWKQGEG